MRGLRRKGDLLGEGAEGGEVGETITRPCPLPVDQPHFPAVPLLRDEVCRRQILGSPRQSDQRRHPLRLGPAPFSLCGAGDGNWVRTEDEERERW